MCLAAMPIRLPELSMSAGEESMRRASVSIRRPAASSEAPGVAASALRVREMRPEAGDAGDALPVARPASDPQKSESTRRRQYATPRRSERVPRGRQSRMRNQECALANLRERRGNQSAHCGARSARQKIKEQPEGSAGHPVRPVADAKRAARSPLPGLNSNECALKESNLQPSD